MKKSFFISVFLMLSLISVKAQSNLEFHYQLYYQTTSQDTTVFDSLCNRICEIQVLDTVNISKIHVKIGTEEGLGDILNYSFAWDVENGLPNGLGYFRNKNTLYLTILQTDTSDVYYYEVYLEDVYGSFSNVKKWN